MLSAYINMLETLLFSRNATPSQDVLPYSPEIIWRCKWKSLSHILASFSKYVESCVTHQESCCNISFFLYFMLRYFKIAMLKKCQESGGIIKLSFCLRLHLLNIYFSYVSKLIMSYYVISHEFVFSLAFFIIPSFWGLLERIT